ncbi:MAG: hypothetical protein IJS61_05975 [Firmicutes bacterium]|nr:hypothetical protein [Bacillota bacterium]
MPCAVYDVKFFVVSTCCKLVAVFTEKKVSYAKLSDIEYMVKVFFENAAVQAPLQERLLCSGSYHFVFEKINKQIMQYRMKTNKGVFGLDEASENIVFRYYGSITAELYRQWLEDGKKLSLEEVTELAARLIYHGMASVVKE